MQKKEIVFLRGIKGQSRTLEIGMTSRSNRQSSGWLANILEHIAWKFVHESNKKKPKPYAQVDVAQYCHYNFLMIQQTDQMANKQDDAQLYVAISNCELRVVLFPPAFQLEIPTIGGCFFWWSCWLWTLTFKNLY